MTSFKGRKNVYICEVCGHRTVTIDKDHGTTPFRTGCMKDGCNGIATSMMYDVREPLTPTHEWYRVQDERDPILRHPSSAQHHRLGGLFIRKIVKPDLKIVH